MTAKKHGNGEKAELFELALPLRKALSQIRLMGIGEGFAPNWIQSWFKLEFIAHIISVTITAKSFYKMWCELFKVRFKVCHSFGKVTAIKNVFLEAIRLNCTFT